MEAKYWGYDWIKICGILSVYSQKNPAEAHFVLLDCHVCPQKLVTGLSAQ